MSDRERLLSLTQKYADGIATADDVAQLQALLRDSRVSRSWFREYLELDAALERAAAFDGRSTADPSRVPTRQRIVAGALVALTILGSIALTVAGTMRHDARVPRLTAFWFMVQHPPATPPSASPAAGTSSRDFVQDDAASALPPTAANLPPPADGNPAADSASHIVPDVTGETAMGASSQPVWKAAGKVAGDKAERVGGKIPFDRALNAASNAASNAAARLTAATVAVVTRDLGAQWGPGAGPADDSLVPGTYDLREGTVEVKFRSGAKAVLVGPARMDVYDASHVSLNTGRVRVTVPEGPDEGSFRVDTPTSRLADAGTEYGVEVQPTGCSLVQVYEGELSASAKVESRWQPEQPIGEGRALRFGDGMEEVPFWPERFVQLLPGPDAPEGRGSLPYNRSRYRSITVPAAPPGVTIDGDLSDWDLSHRIRAACEPPYSEHYFLEGAVMHDREHLYVGAHVGDPHPLRGMISPLENVNRHGMGGAVSLRISTDRQAGWPLRAENVVARLGRPAGPQDLSDKLAFVVMWYYAPSQLPCLHLRYGMDMHGLKVNPDGYRGAFRADTDGRGYTLEYAIPWKLLNAHDDPPRAGDELGFMFLTHWSDAAGKKWQGQLIDVTDPDEHGWNFERAATWGKAIYASPSPSPP